MTENVRNTSIKTRDSCAHLHNIYLIGSIQHQIIGAKLPSNRQVLQVMFYNMRIVCLTAQESANLAIDATEVFGAKTAYQLEERINAYKCLLTYTKHGSFLEKPQQVEKAGQQNTWKKRLKRT